MQSQFEVEAQSNPDVPIAITNYGTTLPDSKGNVGFRVYFRNTSPLDVTSVRFNVQAYELSGREQVGISAPKVEKHLQFNQPLPSGQGAHPLWRGVWQGNDNIACGRVSSVDVTYSDGVKVHIPQDALSKMIYNNNCLNLEGDEYAF
ncbi:hypothetical protein C9I98_26115 [Photobacterium sanctipauli]|uniref:Uncharacterized protein n=2 Tax=Photobacterium sanctipauli TaxID=1342794 RepID=A0A2T3N7R8_9GAMM|nr:hypothetical protein [Photobacterium sanctipauli]PSW09160.1 hypothetical protein C9I98_26115 [Photobacterium sanctipauli]